MKNKQKLLLVFLTSICQPILFGPIYIICLHLIPWPPIMWIVMTSYILIPTLSALSCCFLVHRSNFHFDSQNMVSKVSFCRLAVRLLSVFCFLFIGYILGENNISLNMIFGGNKLVNFILELITNFNYYVMIAIFPTVYALAEYLFVSTKINNIAER